MARKTTRVFLSVQPVGYRRPKGADPFTYQDKRPSRWRASWWTRGTSTELYRSKIVATRDEAIQLALRWLARENKTRVGGPADTQLIDTTDSPERYGYSHPTAVSEDAAPAQHATKKTPAQLQREIDEVLANTSAATALSEEDQVVVDGVAGDYKTAVSASEASIKAANEALAALNGAGSLERRVDVAEKKMDVAYRKHQEARQAAKDANLFVDDITNPVAKRSAKEQARGASVRAKNAESAYSRVRSELSTAQRVLASPS